MVRSGGLAAHAVRGRFPQGRPLAHGHDGASGQQNTPFGGEYLEIVPNRKIVFDNAFEEAGPRR